MPMPVSAPDFTLKGEVALITGGGTGIGRSTAITFAQAGADIVVAGRKAAPLEKVAKEVAALGRKCLAVPTDVTKKTDIENMVKQALDRFGKIDILVNNAGIGTIEGKNTGWFIDLPEKDWDYMLDINLKGVFLCCQAVGRVMVKQKKGSIINISSVAAFRGGNARPYAVSKAGVSRLTPTLAKDLGPYNVRVNAIAPGPCEVEVGVVISESERDSWSSKELLDQIPLGRVAKPIDIAAMALFLASKASNYVTGEVILVDGGLMSC